MHLLCCEVPMKNALWFVNHFILKLSSELAYLQCMISFQDCGLYTKIFLQLLKKSIKNGYSPFLLSFIFDKLFSDNTEVAMERSTKLLWMWKALGGRIDYCLGKKQTNTVFKDQIEIKAGNSVLSRVFNQLMTKGFFTMVSHHSF